MKIIFIYLIALMAFSCSLPEDNTVRSTPEVLPIETAILPPFFEFGQTYEINLSYILPSDCHTFDNIFFQAEDDNERVIAIISSVFPGTDCMQTDNEVETSFDFFVNDTGLYTFKFWQGEDSNGNDIYLTIEVPVEN